METGMHDSNKRKCAVCEMAFVPDEAEKCKEACHVCLEEMRRYCPKCDALNAMQVWLPECIEHVHYGIKLDRAVAKDPGWHNPLKRQIIFKHGRVAPGPSVSIGPAGEEIFKKVLNWLKENHKSVSDLYPDFDPEIFMTSCETCGGRDIFHLHAVHDCGSEALMMVCQACLIDAKTGGSA